jgi:AcrR family transcriptional regulator
MKCDAPKAPPRDRIIETARDLFHRHGIHNVGVDAIAEEAGTNKMTLYRHFRSKDDLIAECMRSSIDEAEEIWADIAADHPGDARAQLEGWIEFVAEGVTEDCRGCDLSNAVVELAEADHPALKVIEAFWANYRAHLAKLCREAGFSRPELLADTLFTLLEGARISRQNDHLQGPSGNFAAMAKAILRSFEANERRPLKEDA